MIWVIFWLVSLILFLLMPILCVEERRNRWWKSLRTCSCNDNDGRNHRRNGTSAQASTDYDELSKAQEDAVRESFLTEGIRAFTISLTPEMIKQEEQATENGSSSSTTDIETGNSSGSLVVVDEKLDEEKLRDDFGDGNAAGKVCGLPLPGDCRHDFLLQCSSSTNNDNEHNHDDDSGSDNALLTKQASTTREVANGCAVCLSAFQANERLAWSSNPECEHVFHEACILDWLQASGRKHLKKMRRDEQRGRPMPDDWPDDPIDRITAFPMLCPCCRQNFVVVHQQKDIEKPNEKPESLLQADTNNNNNNNNNNITAEEVSAPPPQPVLSRA